MYCISKKFEFSAAHALTGLPPEHQCSRIHGHNYIVELVLESPTLDLTGFVRDYGELAAFKKWLDDNFDHRWLGFAEVWLGAEFTPSPLNFNPTAENMAKHFYTYAVTLYPEVTMVGVSETPKTWAWYAPDNLTLDVLDKAIGSLPTELQVTFRSKLEDNA